MPQRAGCGRAPGVSSSRPVPSHDLGRNLPFQSSRARRGLAPVRADSAQAWVGPPGAEHLPDADRGGWRDAAPRDHGGQAGARHPGVEPRPPPRSHPRRGSRGVVPGRACVRTGAGRNGIASHGAGWPISRRTRGHRSIRPRRAGGRRVSGGGGDVARQRAPSVRGRSRRRFVHDGATATLRGTVEPAQYLLHHRHDPELRRLAARPSPRTRSSWPG